MLQDASDRLADATCRIPNAARFSRRWEGEPFTFGVPSSQFLDFSGPGGILTKECECPCPTSPPVLKFDCSRCPWWAAAPFVPSGIAKDTCEQPCHASWHLDAAAGLTIAGRHQSAALLLHQNHEQDELSCLHANRCRTLHTDSCSAVSLCDRSSHALPCHMLALPYSRCLSGQAMCALIMDCTLTAWISWGGCSV